MRLRALIVWLSVLKRCLRHAGIVLVSATALAGCVQAPKFHDSKALNTLVNEYEFFMHDILVAIQKRIVL